MVEAALTNLVVTKDEQLKKLEDSTRIWEALHKCKILILERIEKKLKED